MIWSVSTLLRRSGTPMPVCWVIFSMALLFSGVDELAGGLEVGGRGQGPPDGGRGGDARRDEVRPPALALAAVEVAARGERGPLPRLQLVGVHAQAHRAAGVAPLGTEVEEDLVQALGLGLEADAGRARHDEDADVVVLLAALDDVDDGAQVLDTTVRARADED